MYILKIINLAYTITSKNMLNWNNFGFFTSAIMFALINDLYSNTIRLILENLYINSILNRIQPNYFKNYITYYYSISFVSIN